jgi:hypothetical protein
MLAAPNTMPLRARNWRLVTETWATVPPAQL